MDVESNGWGHSDEQSFTPVENDSLISVPQLNINQVQNLETFQAMPPNAAVESEAIPINGAVSLATPLKGVAIAAGSYADFMRQCQPTANADEVFCSNSLVQELPRVNQNFGIAKTNSSISHGDQGSSGLGTNGEGLDVIGIEAVGNFADFMSKHKGKYCVRPLGCPKNRYM